MVRILIRSGSVAWVRWRRPNPKSTHNLREKFSRKNQNFKNSFRQFKTSCLRMITSNFQLLTPSDGRERIVAPSLGRSDRSGRGQSHFGVCLHRVSFINRPFWRRNHFLNHRGVVPQFVFGDYWVLGAKNLRLSPSDRLL